ncbi:MAG TPA: tetratricopeptide repeat protein, partial [Thermoplasmata archaeon]|nr:tetratricopeptide repeat protein [Thermoplasmata archaeon]
SKYSMSRALTTAVLASFLAVILLVPVTGNGLAGIASGPTRPVSIAPRSSETVLFTSPDVFGVSYVQTIHVQGMSGTVRVAVEKNGGTLANKSVTGSQSVDLSVQSAASGAPANWSLVFTNAGSGSAGVTYTLSVALMPSLFSTVPFLLFLYVAANLGWWFGLRPIRDRTKTEALYAGTSNAAQLDMGERAYIEYAMQPQPSAASAASVAFDPPPPPPTALPPPPVAPAPVPAAPAVAPAAPQPRPTPRPDTADTFAAKGDTLFVIQEYPSAVAAYDESLRLNPNSPRVLLAKAGALTAMNDTAVALDTYRRILALEPTNETALRATSRILAAQSRWRECLETVEAILRRKPNDTSALELKGDVLTNLGRRPEALAAFEAAQALDPQDANLRQKIEEVRVDVPGLLSRALIASASGNYPQALNLFDDILEVEPSNVNALIGKAVAYRRSGKPNEALNCLDLVLDYQPNNASALLNRGNLLLEKGDLDAALEMFDKLVTISPQDEEAWAVQGDVFLKMGRDDDALRAFAEALKLNPGDEEIQQRIHELESSRAVSADVLQDLYTVKGIGPARAKALVDAGFHTVEDYQKATVNQLLAVKGITRRIAEDLVKHFKAPVAVPAH